MRNFDTEPSFGPLDLPRHHYIFDAINILPIKEPGTYRTKLYGHGKDGFEAAKADLEARQTEADELTQYLPEGLGIKPKYELRFPFEGDDYVNLGVSEAPFAKHSNEPKIGDGVEHSAAELKYQAADYQRVVAFNKSLDAKD